MRSRRPPRQEAQKGCDSLSPVSVTDRSQLPYPGDELVYRVQGTTDRDAFFDSGRRSVAETERALAVVGKSWDSFERIFDFGCGCGRMMLWLEHVGARASLHGSDIDERAIRWCQENIPFASFETNRPLPPLPYPDHYFDLIFNHSVFTHLNEEHQDLWLAELRRVAKPGATVILSIHGEWAFQRFEEFYGKVGDPRPLRHRLATDGILFIEEDSWTGGPFPDFYHTTYHAPWYVFSHWGRYFTVKTFLPRADLDFQDMIVFERPASEELFDGVITPSGRRVAAPRENGAGQAVALPEEPAPYQALERAAHLYQLDPDPNVPSRFGEPAKLVRRLILRALRHYRNYQKELDHALLETILAAIRQAEMDSGSLRHSVFAVRDALRHQGERLNRLEADLTASLESLRNRLDPAE